MGGKPWWITKKAGTSLPFEIKKGLRIYHLPALCIKDSLLFLRNPCKFFRYYTVIGFNRQHVIAGCQ